MRPFLDAEGRLEPPPTRPEGVERIKQLRHELAKIEAQLADPQRILDAETPEAYVHWNDAARQALSKFRSEEVQLAAWLTGYKAATDHGEDLLAEAHSLLCDLELVLEFTPEQQGLMAKLDEHCIPPTRLPAGRPQFKRHQGD